MEEGTGLDISKVESGNIVLNPAPFSIRHLVADLTGIVRPQAEQLRPVYEKLEVLYQKGYIDQKVNETYPDDNYDGAILKFFEGDVPFWVCTTECVSGMKKRESKSEAFTEHPFDYEFMFPPLSEDGVYDYEEPWYGFSINKDSDEADYAVDFLRFLTTEEELDKLAEIKGMPSVTADSKNEQYAHVTDPAKQAVHYILNGKVKTGVTSAVADVSNQFGQGNLKNTDEMVEALQKRLEEIQ